MGVPTANATYRFCPHAGMTALHYYGMSAITNGQKVNVMAQDGTRDQLWFFDGTRLRLERNRSYCLDRDKTNNQCDLCQAMSSELINQEVAFEIVTGTRVQCYIRLKNKIDGQDYYLQSDASQCVWVAGKSNATPWEYEKIHRVADLPALSVYSPGSADWFHKSSGLNPESSWTAAPNAAYAANLTHFYTRIFGATPSANGAQHLYNLYGSLMTMSGWAGKFHVGVDMTCGSRSDSVPIRAPFSGTVYRRAGDAFNTLTLYQSAYNYVFRFLHMSRPRAAGSVQKGEILGYLSDVGASGSRHVHVEVAPAKVSDGVVTNTSSAPAPTSSNLPMGDTMSPYVVFGNCLNWG